MQNRNICFILDHLEDGGVQRVTVNFANYMASCGHTVTLLVLVREGKFKKAIADNVKVEFLNKPRVITVIFDMLKFFKRNNFDAIISGKEYINILTFWTCLFAGKRKQFIPIIHTDLEAEFTTYNTFRNKVILFLARFTFKFVPLVVPVSQGVAASVTKMLNYQGTINVIYNPSIAEKNLSYQSNLVKDELYPNKFNLVACGRLVEQKKFALLIDAFNLLDNKDKYHLTILGEGIDRIKLEQQLKKLDLEEHISLKGSVNNVYDYYAYADLFVLSSFWEGFPTVVAESLSAGLPVVAFQDCCGVEEIIKSDDYGVLAQEMTAQSLAKAIEKAKVETFNPELLIKRAANFTPPIALKEYLAVIEGLKNN